MIIAKEVSYSIYNNFKRTILSLERKLPNFKRGTDSLITIFVRFRMIFAKMQKAFEQGFMHFVEQRPTSLTTISMSSSVPRILEEGRLHFAFCHFSDDGFCTSSGSRILNKSAKTTGLLARHQRATNTPFRLPSSKARYAKVYALLLETPFLSCKGGVAPFDPPFQKTHETVFFGSLGVAAL